MVKLKDNLHFPNIAEYIATQNILSKQFFEKLKKIDFKSEWEILKTFSLYYFVLWQKISSLA